MSLPEETVITWDKKKEELKRKFELITDRYSMFEGSGQTEVSEKLQRRFAKTKKELNEIIAVLRPYRFN